MAGEPPDVVIAPRLGQIGLMDFDRAKESIAEGREATKRRVHDIETLPKAVRGN
jgi:NTE family protein